MTLEQCNNTTVADATRAIGRRFCAQLDELLADLIAGSHFQFATVSLWMLLEAPPDADGGGDGDGLKYRP